MPILNCLVSEVLVHVYVLSTFLSSDNAFAPLDACVVDLIDRCICSWRKPSEVEKTAMKAYFDSMPRNSIVFKHSLRSGENHRLLQL